MIWVKKKKKLVPGARHARFCHRLSSSSRWPHESKHRGRTSFHRSPRQRFANTPSVPFLRVHGLCPSLALLTAPIVSGFFGQVRAWFCKASAELCSAPGQLRGAVNGQAELLAVSFAERIDLTYGSDQEMERAHVQYISGSMFGSFGPRPRLGTAAG